MWEVYKIEVFQLVGFGIVECKVGLFFDQVIVEWVERSQCFINIYVLLW